VYQVTLDGDGCYEAGGRRWSVPPGSAFTACIPSAHTYFLPPEAPGPWTFFWMMIEHPYIVDRLRRLAGRRGAVVTITETELTASVNLFKTTCEGRLDETGQEQALFNWLFDLERSAQTQTEGSGDQFLEKVIRYTRENLHRSFGIEELANQHGMSRSHFTRRFRRLTGQSPAAVVLSTRLGKVTDLLADSDLTLREIAEKTGFADANHLGKIFKRKRGLTPGQFRNSRRFRGAYTGAR
jgi:transcriptional regulator GlxA family with amidase domain